MTALRNLKQAGLFRKICKEQHSCHIDQEDTVIKTSEVKLTYSLNEYEPVILHNQSITCSIFNVVSSESYPGLNNKKKFRILFQKISAMANINFINNVHVKDNLVMRMSLC